MTTSVPHSVVAETKRHPGSSIDHFTGYKLVTVGLCNSYPGSAPYEHVLSDNSFLVRLPHEEAHALMNALIEHFGGPLAMAHKMIQSGAEITISGKL